MARRRIPARYLLTGLLVLVLLTAARSRVGPACPSTPVLTVVVLGAAPRLVLPVLGLLLGQRENCVPRG
ncbi:hypothetical protein JOF53_008398 [Crossiella equi]|uniref:Uncharacterized protein n=1 Tax=Crossiella equi TaxID=130796 RepID=A0ABS5ASW8_9PSEU|nr:hypothetical protein [Crossiella equi]MBP2479526.1 hypothetical protein [Crossiella equi]